MDTLVDYVLMAVPQLKILVTVVGTIVVGMSILVPVLVKLTDTKKDDVWWKKLQEGKVFGGLLRFFARFSVVNPNEITKKK